MKLRSFEVEALEVSKSFTPELTIKDLVSDNNLNQEYKNELNQTK